MRRRNTTADGLTASWLGQRLGIEPLRIEIMRRAGELCGVRPPGSQEYVYPSWQFAPGFRPLPGLDRVVRAAREAGLSDEQLNDVIHHRSGLVQGRRLVDLLREGRIDHVLEAVRQRSRA